MILFLGTGIDVVEIEEFRETADEDVRHELFSDAELAAMPLEVESVAARFCAKEAFVKASNGLALTKDWHDFQVLPGEGGAVRFEFSKPLADALARIGTPHVSLSLTHSASAAAANVILILEARQ